LAGSQTFLRSFLRQQTADVHARLDDAIGCFDSPRAYARYLRGALAFREPIEAALAQASIPPPDGWRLCPLASSIRADMTDLALPPNSKPAPAPVRIADTSDLLGTLYVLEGSALGARILLQRARKLGFSEDFGARHLALQTRDQDNWRNVLGLLERHEPSQADATAKASIAAFALAVEAFAPGSAR
jgi:heme oxygenase